MAEDRVQSTGRARTPGRIVGRLDRHDRGNSLVCHGSGMTRDSPSGRPWRRMIAAITENGTASCWICGHAGAMTVDHVVPRKHWPRDEYGQLLPGVDDPENLRPAHGTRGPRADPNRCMVCGQLCNQNRGTGKAPMRVDWEQAEPHSRDWSTTTHVQ